MNDVDSAIMIMVQSPLSTAMPNSAWRETIIITHHFLFDSANINDEYCDTVLPRQRAMMAPDECAGSL